MEIAAAIFYAVYAIKKDMDKEDKRMKKEWAAIKKIVDKKEPIKYKYQEEDAANEKAA